MPYRDPSARRRASRLYYAERVRPQREAQAAVRELETGAAKKGYLNARLPMQMIARLVRIKDEGIATGQYPWRSVSAVIEALLLRGLESMAGDPFIDEMLQYLRVTSQIEGIAAHRREAQAAVSRFKVEIGELLKIKANEQAVQYFHSIYHDFQQMDANVWREWALEEMRKAYPVLHKAMPHAVILRGPRDRRKAARR